jgi:glycosyltransferase involved in cell wall biosynthesis
MCLDPVAGGGSVERIYQLSKHLALLGHECTILTTKQGWDEKHIAGLGNVDVVALPYTSERYKIPLGLMAWLNNHIHEFDVVHLGMNWTIINAISYLFLRYYKRPYLFSAMGWLSIDGRSKVFKFFYKKIFSRAMVRNASLCIAITNREVNDYLSIGANRNKIMLIPNGVIIENQLTEDAFNFFRIKNNIDQRPIILFIGRLNLIKGPDLLLKAFAAASCLFPGYQLIIAGNDFGGFLAELKRLSADLSLDDKVTFIGPIFGTEKQSAYCSADLFVIPSRFDTMTIVALEAAVNGTPVLLTDQCDFLELQESGGGLVVKATIDGLQTGLKTLLSNKEQLTEMGNNAKKYVTDKYNWLNISNQFIIAFNNAISSHKDIQ